MVSEATTETPTMVVDAPEARVRLVQVAIGLEPTPDGAWRPVALGEQVALYVGETGEAVVHRERNDTTGVSHPAGTDARALAAFAAGVLRAFADERTALTFTPYDFRRAADALDAKARDAGAWQVAE